MRDLTKILSDAETVKLRALLAQAPDFPADEHLGQEYPKMLFHKNYIELYRLVKDHPDPLVKKEAQQKMPRVIVVVHDIETEEDYLSDGDWKTDPNDFITMSVEDGGLGEPDPRIPTGREGRRASQIQRATREQELRDLRRRYAELTGRKLADESDAAPEPVAAVSVKAATVAAKPAPVPAGSKRERVAAAARSAAKPGHSAHA